MTRKRRITKSPPPPPMVVASKKSYTSPPPLTPVRISTRSTTAQQQHSATMSTPPARAKTTATAIASTPSPAAASHLSHLPVLSPPLKKRIVARNDARSVKAPSLEDAFDDLDDDRFSSNNRHFVQPDPHLPDPYRRHATVLLHNGSVYDAMLTRARVHQSQCEFIALQALELDSGFYLWQRAGSLGFAGKHELTGPFASAERVVVEFTTVFHTKTSCRWENKNDPFEYQDGSYTWIELDYSSGTPYRDVASAAAALLETTSDGNVNERSATKRRRSSRSTTATTTATTVQTTVQTTASGRISSSAYATATATTATTTTQARTSKLPADVQAFVAMIADPHDAYDVCSYDESDDVMEEAQKMPLGRLHKTTIQRGYETLEKLYVALQSRTTSRTQLLHLSSLFYAIIPHHARLDAIDTMVKLGKKVALMARVCESVRGLSAFAVVAQCQQRNYVDECYDLLGCCLAPLAEASSDYRRIQTYVKNANCCGWKDGTLQLVQVFSVKKADDATRFAPFASFPNRRILWHGSRLSNWLGILTDGLRIAPPDVASNGRIFGKGLYFTDKVSKAQAYCHASVRTYGSSSSSATCVFVLSEVALGAVKELVASDESAKRYVHASCGGHAKATATTGVYNSCKGMGTCRPDPRGDVEDAGGALWPLGKPVGETDATGLSHSEFIVYNAAQARMRFVVVAKSAY